MAVQLDKSFEKAINDGEMTVADLTSHLLKNYTVYELAEALAELLIKERKAAAASTPIALSEEDYERVVSMFRIKGQRFVDGAVIRETRGRPMKSMQHVTAKDNH